MKKLMFSFLLIMFILPPVCLFACSCSSLPEGYCYVYYYVDGEEFSKTYEKRGEVFCMPTIEEREGYVFKGWYRTEEYIEKWDFENDTVKSFLRLYGYWIPEDEETFNILFYDDAKLLSYQKIPKGGLASLYDDPKKTGYNFEGWLYQNNKFDFNTEITSDIILKANWTLIDYTITFIAEGEIVNEVKYNVENKNITVPEVPPKDFYTGKWTSYTLNFENIEVEAVYTPIEYTATFVADNKTVKRIKYTVEDIEDTLVIPDVPEKKGYSGEWSNLPIAGGNVTLTACYTPIVYTITYMVDDSVYTTGTYTIETVQDIVNPPVPVKEGRTGSWEKVTFETGDVTINAVYVAKIYTATFIADGSIIGTVNFQYDAMSVKGNEPNVPQKTGYTASWEPYSLKYEDIQIEAKYVPITYTASFYINEQKVADSLFTIESESLIYPDITEWKGYYVKWEEIEIEAKNVDSDAILTPITYFVTFIADNKEIAKVEYNVEDKDIDVPTPPPKDKYTVKWEDFELTLRDITVKAVYTPISDEELNFIDEFTYEENTDGTLSVTGYNGSADYLYVPSEHDGKPVKSIAKLAFSGSNITGIKINEGIESIGDDAFLNCANLLSVQLPDSLTTIGKNAFAWCKFKTIKLPDNIIEIGEDAFKYSAIEYVVLPKKLAELKNSFNYCENLQSITLNENLTELKAYIFVGCPSLKSITIPANIKLIEAYTFASAYIEDMEEANADIYIEEVNLAEPENWKIYSVSGVELPNIDYSPLSDKSTAALWLTKTYIERDWKKST